MMMIRFWSKSGKGKVHAADRFMFQNEGWHEPANAFLSSLCHHVISFAIDSEWDHETKVTCENCRREIRNRIANLQSAMGEEQIQ